MVTTKSKRRTIKLDEETVGLLTVLAQQYENNTSLTLRMLIRQAARTLKQQEA